MVPVVYGGANYSLLAPPHSYIDALDYSPQELADYLIKLNRNDTLYNEYFWWKGHYRVEAGVDQMARYAFCDLCRKLHLEEQVVNIYNDMVPEWSTATQCFQLPAWGSVNTIEMKNILILHRSKKI